MAVSLVADSAGGGSAVTGTFVLALPSTATTGDRMFIFATWKDQSVTASISGWTSITSFADGSVGSGNGTGSMRVEAWYRDHSGSESAPTVTFSGAIIGAALSVAFRKGGSETWDTPLFATAAITNWTTTSQTVSASSTVAVPSSGVVIGWVGIRDDSATFTRPTNGIDDSTSAITWNGNFSRGLFDPHISTTTGNDMSADWGHRLVTIGATATLRQTATISAAETGSSLWVVQGATAGGGGADAGFPYVGGGYYP